MSALSRLLDHGQIMMGPEVIKMERVIAEHCNSAACVAVNSGTNALYLALRALDIGPGDEVVTSCMSWVASASAIRMTGAQIVFADILDDLNIDPASVADLINHRTKAIVPVHFNGRIGEIEKIVAISKASKVKVIEDSAQAFGARLNGRHAGTFGEIGIFSFNPMKVLPSLGEAGAVVLADQALAARVSSLRYLGTIDRDHCVEPDLNHKISALQAAFIVEIMPFLPSLLARRRAIAARYDAGLSEILQIPPDSQDERTVNYDYTVQVDHPAALRDHLQREGIESRMRYNKLLPDHAGFANEQRAILTNGRRLAARILSLPIEPQMADADVDLVIGCVRRFFGK